ncbi:MSHA biogenesis protein MshQ [Vibrio crassostreae]|nr:MSHA biogenesis protein MshQ [Vibrio crassostreae]CAK2346074.1 MSHA biogenesis protein MshQ [Vibrio crassostreae]CAK2512387.1 MSHA biogenesis protein MshQ [Vibrio crassostreae]CAK2940019.1 MSHA biogenesis protein MshQ [Vibrio crassostreae]
MEVCKYILVAFFTLFPLLVSASTCNVNPSGEFKISFNITSAQLLESVTAEKEPGNNNTEYVIWTNDTNVQNVGDTPYIRDPSYMMIGGDYSVEIIYQPGVGGNAGTADYYVDDGQGFTFLGNYEADFKGIHPQSVNIDGGNSSNLECDSSDTTPPPLYSRDAQFQFGVMQCTGSECKIPLNKPFTNTPLVFVMPTIASNNPDLDAPATLVVTNVTKTEATIEQIKAPKNGGGADLNSQPMTEVSYLAIEPGVADFNGHQVIAGYIETDEASAKSGSNDNDRVFYSDFGGGAFSSNPVVLHQIQTRNNSTKWMTSGKVKRTNERSYVDLFLELSASHNSNLDYEDEKIAFLATLPTNSNLEVDGYKVQFARGYDTPSQNGNDPMLDGCEDKYAITSLANVDGIIANKQERAGGHGGWLRRCNINNDQVSFVVDEDFRDRTHIPEEVGYFAFEIDDISIDICEIFPAPVSSWKNNSQVTFNNAPNFPNGEPLKYFIGGWSGESCSPSENNCQDIRMGFDRLTDYSNYQYTCQTGTCVTGGEKVDASKLPSINFPELNGDVVFSNSRPDEIDQTGSCEAALVGDTCHPAGQGDGVININVDLNSLTLAYGGSDYPVEYRFPANKKVYIGNLTSNSSNVTLAVGANTYHYFKTLKFNSTNNTIKVSSKSAILIKDSLIFNSPADVNNDHVSDDLIFYGPEADATFNIASGAIVNAHILFDSIQFNNGGTIGGSVITNSLTIHDANTVILGQNSCYSPPASYQLDLTPNKDFSLLCETPQVTVTVTDSQGNPATEQVEVYITTPTGITVDSVIEGRHNGGNSYSTNLSGILTLGLDADLIGTYKIEAELASDSNQSDSGDFLVSLYKFEASDIYAVAGLAASFDLKVLACKDDTATPVLGYQGDKTLNVSDFSLVNPTSTQGAVDGNLLVKSKSDWSDTSVVFEFDSSAQTTGSIIYSEAGKVSFKLSDPTFECPTGYDCEDNDGDSWDSLEGIVEVYVRPWKFAICTSNNSDGNSSGGSAFAAAGEEFDVFAKPIRFTSDASQQCNNSLVTQNYLLSSGAVGAAHTLDTPSNSGAVLGSLEPTSQLTQSSSDIVLADNGYKFKNLKYSEAGSFNFEVAEDSNSFYGKILGGLSGSKSIGRFYPKFFVQGTPEWIVADQNNIAYLSQPYDSTVHQVYPMASGESDTDDALNNYRFFSSDLQASFGILDDTSIDNDFLLDTDAGTWSADRKHWLLNDSAAVLERVTDSDGVSRKDNPFNTSDTNSTVTHFGLTVDGADPVSFTDSDPVTDSAVFPVQPPARYGRIVLDDIGGNSDTTLTIPLRAEFWDGSEFVVNEDDDRSTFNGANTCKQVIWHSEGAATTLASLNGSGNVDEGEEEVTANQNTPAGTDSPREQVRLWLRMDDSEPSKKTGENDISCSGSDQDQPWLRYNWRQLGDEDPSTVVTFGIYRGNDRVIYRGESGLTGQ